MQDDPSKTCFSSNPPDSRGHTVWLDYLSYAAVDFGAVDCKFGHLGVDASGETVCTYFYCLFSLEIAQLEYCIMRHRGCYSAHAVQVQR